MESSDDDGGGEGGEWPESAAAVWLAGWVGDKTFFLKELI